jgi:PAS domain-containing protein
MALTLAVLSRMLRMDNLRMRVAINNMSQGLCMFDGNERLVVCNQRYMDMYKVSGDIVNPGITLQNLLEYRIRNGSFTHDPIEYRRDLVGAMSAGKTTSTEVKSADGRSITVINRPPQRCLVIQPKRHRAPMAPCRPRTRRRQTSRPPRLRPTS